jgi:hypothetical protein
MASPYGLSEDEVWAMTHDALKQSGVPRDPNYDYGNILPYRKPKKGGDAEWDINYSNLAKSLMDAFTAPGRAYQGQPMSDEEAMNVAMNLIGGGAAKRLSPGELGMTGYHGTPHTFPPTKNNPLGEFDLSKIGTGEGAQSYGQGAAYIAEAKDVAKGYREKLSSDNAGPYDKKRPIVFDKETATWKQVPPENPPGNLYHVDVPDTKVAKMLDWDKPFKEQPPNVQLNILNEAKNPESPLSQGLSYGGWTAKDIMEAPDGAFLYSLMSGPNFDHGFASRYIQSLGIPGIKYLDAASRAKGQGTRNMVVFHPDDAKIIGKE